MSEASVAAAAQVAADAVRVLVVDDDPLSRSLQARMVALLGHASLIAPSPQDALQTALNGEVDALLVDLGMPEMDGFALLARLREEEARLRRVPVPVIAVTGYASQVDRLRCLMAGFNDHLSKPVDVDALRQVLDRNLVPRRGSRPTSNGDSASDLQRVQATARRLAHVKPSDRSFGPTMLEAFAMRSGQLVEELHATARSGDLAELARLSQSLHSSADFMGASGMARLCAQIRDAAAAGNAAPVGALLHQLSEEHQAVLSILLAPGHANSPL